MAGKTVDKLYVSLGVNDAELKVGLEKADLTVNQALQRLNAKARNIKLEAELKIAGLEKTGSELDKLKIKAEALQAQLDLSNQKVDLSQQVFDITKSKYGADNPFTQKAQTNLLYRQKDALKLKNELADITQQLNLLEGASAKMAPKVGGMFTQLSMAALRAKLGISGVTGEVGKASVSINSLSGVINKLNAQYLAIVSTIAAAGGIFAITDKAINTGENLYRIMTRLNVSQKEAAGLSKLMTLGDADLNSTVSFLTKLDKQVISNGDSLNATRIALDKYKISLTDENGVIVSKTEQLKRLADGYKRAARAGEEENFVAELLGAKGASLVNVLRNYADYMQIISKIPVNGLLDAKQAHEAWLEWQQMTMTMGQLTSVVGQSLLPISKELMPEIINLFSEMVVFIRQNKDEIKAFGEIGVEALEGLLKISGSLVKSFGGIKEDLNVIRQAYGKDAADNKMMFAQTVGGAAGARLGRAGGVKTSAIGALLGSQIAKDLDIGLNKAWLKLLGEWDKAEAEYRESLKKSSEETKSNTEETKENNEAAHVSLELLEKRKKAMQELTESVFSLTHSDLENALHSLDKEITQYKEVGVSPDLLGQFEEAKKNKLYEDFNRNVVSKVNSIWQSALETRLQQIEEEKQAYIKKGLSEVEADKWAAEQKRQVQQNNVKQMFTQQKKYLDLYREAMAGGGSEEDKTRRAQSLIVAQMKKDNGIDQDAFTTPGEIKGFNRVMDYASKNLIPVVSDEVMKGAIQVIRGNKLSLELPDRSGLAMNGAIEVLRGNKPSYEMPDMAGLNYSREGRSAQSVNVTTNLTVDMHGSINSNDVVDTALNKANDLMDERTNELSRVINNRLEQYSYAR